MGPLPATRRWKDVIGLIAEGAEASRIAEATAHAWGLAFDTVKNDAGFREAVWLLTQLGVCGCGRIAISARITLSGRRGCSFTGAVPG
jgi:hypothetical protein